jgi:ATP-binding cassette subfamily F protein 3
MLLVDVNRITVLYGVDIVLKDCSLRIAAGQRIGLIGRNGEGKTTLLETILGIVRPESGSVSMSSQVKTTYLRQKQDRVSDRTLFEEMLDVFSDIIETRNRIRQLEQEMQVQSDQRILSEYGHLLDAYENSRGDMIENRIDETLKGLGFDETDYVKRMSELSGGQKNRAALAAVLLSGADLLLLDEPTNHLDLEGINFLENFLTNFSGGAVIVSHDRAFLDNVVTSICEVERHQLYSYPDANYSEYVPIKAKNIELQRKRYDRQQDEIRRTKDFIARNIAGQKTKQAQSRRLTLQKMNLVEKPIIYDAQMKPVIGDIPRSGLNVVEAENVFKSFNGHRVLEDAGFKLERGEAVGIIGPNACGKTTLLKIITGEMKADNGEVKIGSNVSIGYFAQHREDIEYSRRIIDQVWDLVPDWEEVKVRGYLGRFLFTGEDSLRLAKSLSGGEISRLALAKLFLKRHNFLIMDEPTNHLDIASREVLEDTLSVFPGTLLIVSHDRYFLNNIVDRIYAFENGRTVYYAGDYDYYLRKKKEITAPAEAKPEKAFDEVSGQMADLPASGSSRRSYLQSKEKSRKLDKLKKIESRIEKLERKIAEHWRLMESEGHSSDWSKLDRLRREVESFEKQLNELIEQWEELYNRI